MRIGDFLRRWADRVDPPQAPVIEPDIEMPELPQGSTVLIDTTNHAQIVGQPDAHFMRRELVFTDMEGAKHKVTLKNNLHAGGCGHSMTSPADIGFISYISKKPVCKICEREYKRMRNETRKEECVCRHLVAPHELFPIEGKGFACELCKKEVEAFKPLKAVGWLLRLFLKSLIIEEPKTVNEVSYETLEPTAQGPQPSIQYYPQARPGYRSPHQTPHELDRGRPQGPDHLK